MNSECQLLHSGRAYAAAIYGRNRSLSTLHLSQALVTKPHLKPCKSCGGTAARGRAEHSTDSLTPGVPPDVYGSLRWTPLYEIDSADVPHSPGTYLVRRRGPEVLYIGEADELARELEQHRSGDVLRSIVAQRVYDGRPFHATNLQEMSDWVQKRYIMENFDVAWILADDMTQPLQRMLENLNPTFTHRTAGST